MTERGIAQEARGATLHLALVTVILIAASVGVLTYALPAGAAPPPKAAEFTNDCPSDDGGDSQETLAIKASCRATAERLEALQTSIDAQDYATVLASIDGKLDSPLAVTCDETCVNSAVEATLSDEDHHRLDLMWWGVWAIVGLTLVLLIATPWYRAWNIEGKLGRS